MSLYLSPASQGNQNFYYIQAGRPYRFARFMLKPIMSPGNNYFTHACRKEKLPKAHGEPPAEKNALRAASAMAPFAATTHRSNAGGLRIPATA